MPTSKPVLELSDLRPLSGPDELPATFPALRLMPGELALVEARDPSRAAWFADLCCGLVQLSEGSVRFLGHDWTRLPHDYAAALRGRIGRVFANGGWVEFLDVAGNILLPQLHHSRLAPERLRERAIQLACAFGLPGLPLGHISDLSAFDLARAGCVRAFLGEPALLLLESPVQGQFDELKLPLLNAAAAARGDGAAILWLTRSDLVWGDRSFPATYRFRLSDRGLAPARRAA
jgi:phospholipid/cholesterol/gamma-HCH transport system ATP-binding protein